MPTDAPTSPPSQATIELHEFVWKNVGIESADAESLRPQVMEWLEKGADLNYPTLDSSQEAGYPLAVACAAGSSEWAEMLLEMGSRVVVAPRMEDLADDSWMPATPFDALARVMTSSPP